MSPNKMSGRMIEVLVAAADPNSGILRTPMGEWWCRNGRRSDTSIKAAQLGWIDRDIYSMSNLNLGADREHPRWIQCTVYRITDAGRTALRTRLGEDSYKQWCPQ